MSLNKNIGRLRLFGFDLNYVLDIGAHLGSFSKLVNSIFPNCKLILFEPNKICFEQLKKLNYETYDWLLYKESNKKLKFYYDSSNDTSTGRSIYIENTKHFKNKDFDYLITKKLDDFKSDENIDLIKLDVQGAELDILQGALNTLSKTKFVLIETSLINYNLGAPLENKIIKYMKHIGFKRYINFDQHFWQTTEENTLGLNYGDIFQNDLVFINNKVSRFYKLKFFLLKVYIRIKN